MEENIEHCDMQLDGPVIELVSQLVGCFPMQRGTVIEKKVETERG